MAWLWCTTLSGRHVSSAAAVAVAQRPAVPSTGMAMLDRANSAFADLAHLAERLMAIVAQWNTQAHPFNWSTKSAAKVMAKCEAQAAHVPAA